MTESDVRRFFPNATWMPWDEPPVGTKVVDDSGIVGTVVGRSQEHKKSVHDCPCCTCTQNLYSVSWWWEVELESEVLAGRRVLKYPPALKLVKDS